MTSYWHPDPDYPGWYCRHPLSNGQFLVFSATDMDILEIYTLSLVICDDGVEHLNEYGDDNEDVWVKEGEPTGPGGTEVFGLLPGMLMHMEYLVRKQGGSPIFKVGAATRKLDRIYEHFLTRRGYTRVAGQMLKMLG